MKKTWQTGRKPLVVAFTAVYNQLSFCVRAVQSLEQNHGLDAEDFRYILYDQASPYPLVQEWLADKDAEIWGGKNIGIGAAMNEVIAKTTGEFWFKYDDDNTIDPHTLPALISAHYHAAQAQIPLAILSADVRGVGKSEAIYDEIEVFPGLTLQFVPCCGGGAVLIPRAVMEDIGPWRADRLYGVEDGDYAMRAAEKGYRSAYLKGYYHTSYCRGEEADESIDRWKTAYHQGETDLSFDEWRSQHESQPCVP